MFKAVVCLILIFSAISVTPSLAQNGDEKRLEALKIIEAMQTLGFIYEAQPSKNDLNRSYETLMRQESAAKQPDFSRINELMDAWLYLSALEKTNPLLERKGEVPLREENLAYYLRIKNIYETILEQDATVLESEHIQKCRALFKAIVTASQVKTVMSEGQKDQILIRFALQQMLENAYWLDEFNQLFKANPDWRLQFRASSIVFAAKLKYISKIFVWKDASVVASNYAIELKIEHELSFDGVIGTPSLSLKNYLVQLDIQGFPKTPKEFLSYVAQNHPKEFETLAIAMAVQLPLKTKEMIRREYDQRELPRSLQKVDSELLDEVFALDETMAKHHFNIKLHQGYQWGLISPMLDTMMSTRIFGRRTSMIGMYIDEMKRGRLPGATILAAHFSRYPTWSFFSLSLPISARVKLLFSNVCALLLK